MDDYDDDDDNDYDDNNIGDIYAHLLLLQNMHVVHTFLFSVHTIRSDISPVLLPLKHFMPFDIVIQNSLKIESPP